MAESDAIGDLIDLDEWRSRLAGRAKSAPEIREYEERLERLRRQGRAVGAKLGALVEWEAISSPGPLVEDAAARQGIAWSRSYQPGQPGTLLWGRAGTGKTTLCCHALHRLQAEGWTVALVSTARLLRALAAERWTSDLLSDVAAVDVLVLDDLGSGFFERGWGGWLCAVLDARWTARRRLGASLLGTSNLDPATHPTFGWAIRDEQDLGDWDRAVDRLLALCPRLIEYGGQSRRHGGL